MTPEIMKRAFDPFFSTRFTGRGLGLPAVRGIVRAYAGRLSVETGVGRGTRVEVWLPVSTS
jgi:signal transduction histidine kinase